MQFFDSIHLTLLSKCLWWYRKHLDDLCIPSGHSWPVYPGVIGALYTFGPRLPYICTIIKEIQLFAFTQPTLLSNLSAAAGNISIIWILMIFQLASVVSSRNLFSILWTKCSSLFSLAVITYIHSRRSTHCGSWPPQWATFQFMILRRLRVYAATYPAQPMLTSFANLPLSGSP